MILCQLTDLHIRAPGSLAYGRVDTNKFFEAAIDELAALNPAPDAYLLTGDLTDFGRADEYATLARGVIDASAAVCNCSAMAKLPPRDLRAEAAKHFSGMSARRALAQERVERRGVAFRSVAGHRTQPHHGPCSR
jgi:3',5'-cyclic AMP phosphodiesterase CpdA